RSHSSISKKVPARETHYHRRSRERDRLQQHGHSLVRAQRRDQLAPVRFERDAGLASASGSLFRPQPHLDSGGMARTTLPGAVHAEHGPAAEPAAVIVAEAYCKGKCDDPAAPSSLIVPFRLFQCTESARPRTAGAGGQQDRLTLGVGAAWL